MKIHYKTILIVDGDYRKEFYGDEMYFVVHTGKNVFTPCKIDYCCDTMKRAIVDNILYVQEVGNSNDNCGIALLLNHNDGDGGAWYYHPLKYCPFCGEIITLVEDYKAKEGKRKVHIPAKTTPARNEMRTYEIKIK